jgi:hypothetical protein
MAIFWRMQYSSSRRGICFRISSASLQFNIGQDYKCVCNFCVSSKHKNYSTKSEPKFIRIVKSCAYKLKKIKLPLCLIKHHAMKTYEGVEV